MDPQYFDPDSDSTCHPDADPDSVFLFDADPDPTFLPDPDADPAPYPDPSYQIKTQTFENCSKRLIFHTFLLVICKLMRIRFRIKLNTDADPNPDFYLMRMRIQVTKMMRIHNIDLKGGHHERFFGSATPTCHSG